MTVYIASGSVCKPFQANHLHQYLSSLTSLSSQHVSVLVDAVYGRLKQINTQQEIDNEVVTVATEMVVLDRQYSTLAVKMLMDDILDYAPETFLDLTRVMRSHVDGNGRAAPLVNDAYYQYVMSHPELDDLVDPKGDEGFGVFGLRTLQGSYLKSVHVGEIIRTLETPTMMRLRLAVALHFRNPHNTWKRIRETYQYLVSGLISHASPTQYNAGTMMEQLSSCVLINVDDDAVSIGDSWKNCSVLSKNAAGLGGSLSNIRCKGSLISSNQGKAGGMNVMSVYDSTLWYADQAGRRPGSFAPYLEIWHGDIYQFIDAKRIGGSELFKARTLFPAVYICDLFMHRARANQMWSLMCPDACPGLTTTWGEEFEALYLKYEAEGRVLKQVNAQEVLLRIYDSIFETGSPFITFKDATNRKSNCQNLGIIASLNLCTEVALPATSTDYAVCNLASVCVNRFYNPTTKALDHMALFQAVRVLVRNLNNVIDYQTMPIKEVVNFNLRHRPIGIGIQGLADLFVLLRTPFGSPLARQVNKLVFETIYYAAVHESCRLAKRHGAYEGFPGSPMSKGIFQFDMCKDKRDCFSGLWDWDKMRTRVIRYGVRNVELTCVMPTASTSHILGNNECVEPFTEMVYLRSINVGEFYVVNPHLETDLTALGLWNEEMINTIKYLGGSVQRIEEIPLEIRELYKTAREIPQRVILDMYLDRAPFITMAQSINYYLPGADYGILNSIINDAWEGGAKNGVYYTHIQAVKSSFTVNPIYQASLEAKYGPRVQIVRESEPVVEEQVKDPVCRRGPDCVSCSS